MIILIIIIIIIFLIHFSILTAQVYINLSVMCEIIIISKLVGISETIRLILIYLSFFKGFFNNLIYSYNNNTNNNNGK